MDGVPGRIGGPLAHAPKEGRKLFFGTRRTMGVSVKEIRCCFRGQRHDKTCAMSNLAESHASRTPQKCESGCHSPEHLSDAKLGPLDQVVVITVQSLTAVSL